MKKTILALVTIACLCLPQANQAAPKEGKGKAKTKTISGTGLCAKCALKETDTCQGAIQVEKDGTKMTYYMAQNDVSKKFHEKICQAPAKVKATGTVKKVNGKMELTPNQIDLVK